MLARQGKYDEAIAELDRLIASAPKGSEKQRAAMLAKSESLAGLKKFQDAETLVREVIKGNPAEDADAQAPAYNTLGDCLRAAGRPKEALIAYLHTDLLYSKDKEEHPRAFIRSRRCSASSSRTPEPMNSPSGSSRSIPAAPGIAHRPRLNDVTRFIREINRSPSRWNWAPRAPRKWEERHRSN